MDVLTLDGYPDFADFGLWTLDFGRRGPNTNEGIASIIHFRYIGSTALPLSIRLPRARS